MKRETQELNKELEHVAPTLMRFKRAQMPPPPAGYFERLPEEVLRRIRAEEASGIWRRGRMVPRAVQHSWWSRLTDWLGWPAAGLAFAVVLVLVLARLWWNQSPQATPLAEVPFAALHDYVLRHLDEFGEELLWEVAPVEELWLELSVDDELLDKVGRKWLEEMPVMELVQ